MSDQKGLQKQRKTDSFYYVFKRWAINKFTGAILYILILVSTGYLAPGMYEAIFRKSTINTLKNEEVMGVIKELINEQLKDIREELKLQSDFRVKGEIIHIEKQYEKLNGRPEDIYRQDFKRAVESWKVIPIVDRTDILAKKIKAIEKYYMEVLGGRSD